MKDAAQVAQKLADELQLELVDVELVQEPTGRFLRFYVEKGDGVSVNEFEAFHRKLQPLGERVDYDFLEVSSPGADRPLKSERDFERAEGIMVELSTSHPIHGAKRFTGELKGLADGEIVLDRRGGGTPVPKKDVARVKPRIDFTERDLEDDSPAKQ